MNRSLPEGFAWVQPSTLGEVTGPDILAARAILAAWAHSPGISPPLSDYPSLLDVGPLWGTRDGVMMHAFDVWWNGSGKTPPLPDDVADSWGTVVGPLDDQHLAALKAWSTGQLPTGCPSGQWLNPLTMKCEPIPPLPPGFQFPTVPIPSAQPSAQASQCVADCQAKHASDPTGLLACMAACAQKYGPIQQPGIPAPTPGQPTPTPTAKCPPGTVWDSTNLKCQPLPPAKQGTTPPSSSSSLIWWVGGAVLLGGLAWAVKASKGAVAVRENPLKDNPRQLSAKPDAHGRHPKYKHLVMFEIEPHYGSYILTAVGHSGDALISSDDAAHMFGTDKHGDIREYGYLTDEYLQLLESGDESR